jgi:diaminohydroxyphosphoribosylaminopyrimidine deaminase/5-amino-6-(5-phosphoribosylamino)uracil reductase
VHGQRNLSDAIIVGAGTIQTDNPQLTTRLGQQKGRDAVRVVLDSSLRTSPLSKVYRLRSPASTVVATLQEASAPRARRFLPRTRGTELWTLPADRDRVALEPLLSKLWEQGWHRVWVEGGAEVFSSFVRESLADELWVVVAPKLLGGDGHSWLGPLGISKMKGARPLRLESMQRLGDDVLLQLLFESK